MSKDNRRKFKKREYCPECYDKNLIYDKSRDEVYCGTCGLIIQAPKRYTAGRKIIYPEPYNYMMLKRDIHYTRSTRANIDRNGYYHKLPDQFIINRYRKSQQTDNIEIYYKF